MEGAGDDTVERRVDFRQCLLKHVFMKKDKAVVIVDLKSGFSCNNNCVHCVTAGKESVGDLSLDEIREEIDHYIKKYKTIDLVITGGEFSIRPDFAEVLDVIDQKKRQGAVRYCALQTNGRELSKVEKAARFAKSIDIFLVAIHGDTARLADSITRADGSFHQTTRAIKNLLKLGVMVRTQTVINRRNAAHLYSTFKYIVEKLGIRSGNLTFPHPSGNACSRGVVPTYEEIQKELNRTVRYLMERRFDCYIEMTPPCIYDEDLREYVLQASADPRKGPVVGTDKSRACQPRDIAYKDLMSRGYRKPDFCRKCHFDKTCVGVWKEYFSFYRGKGLKAVM